MEQKKTVLIVEDEKNIVDIIRFNLQRTGYNTLEAYDGEAGLAMAREKKPDLILLDVMMPKMMGFDVCRALRAEGDNVPVIILTAREEEEDKILGLEIGADDYITKPFSMRELLARVKANIRRTTMLSAPAAEDNAMSAGGGITINTDSFQVRKNGVPIDLTQREYELLTFLASHPGKVFSRVDLMEQVWNYGYVGDDVENILLAATRARWTSPSAACAKRSRTTPPRRPTSSRAAAWAIISPRRRKLRALFRERSLLLCSAACI